MGSEEPSCWYEDLRKKNVERNKTFLRNLGLDMPGSVKQPQSYSLPSRRGVSSLPQSCLQPRRSARLAELCKWSLKSSEFSRVAAAEAAISPHCEEKRHNGVLRRRSLRRRQGRSAEVFEGNKFMDEYGNIADGYSTEGSSDSMYGVHVDMDIEGRNSIPGSAECTQIPVDGHGASSSAYNLNFGMNQSIPPFGTQFQEMVIRALFQSTAALMGPSLAEVSPEQMQPMGSPLLSTHGALPYTTSGSMGSPMLSTQGPCPASTWSEATYNKDQARRKRKPQVTRVSAGENSDSQEEFPVPENESPQQKSLRTRRLNRSRARRAQQLTSNRRAVNKVPYVIHVDGTGKARGIHKHQWRAAVRGQCGRLDPSMDNINHHPKHVVDSIWHALEKEWEFQGFAHRAREMFERAATKFMRNRKMQLKYKFRKTVDGTKPDDVNDKYWSKIKDLTKKSGKHSMATTSQQSTPKGKEIKQTIVQEKKKKALQEQGIKNADDSASPEGRTRSDSDFMDDYEIDARIRGLQREVLNLQRSKESGSVVQEDVGKGKEVYIEEEIVGTESDEVMEGMKENMKPSNGNVQELPNVAPGSFSKKQQVEVHGTVPSGMDGKKSAILVDALREVCKKERADKLKATGEEDMDCGDVVRVFALSGGKKKEVGKAIVMGLAGSKHARKVIPEGWRSIKITSGTFSGAEECCPLPAGWLDSMKQQTVKEASGRTIVWPDNLLQSVADM